MNFKRLIAVLIAVVCVCAVFVSCKDDEGDIGVKVDLTQAPQVSFNLSVRNVTAKKNIVPKTDYTYCGDDMKITAILDWFCEVDYSATDKLKFALNADGSIKTIGTLESGKHDGGFWRFYMMLNGEEYGETRDTKGLNYYDYVVKDGDEIQICFEMLKTD